MAGVYWRVNTGPTTGTIPLLVRASTIPIFIHDCHVAIQGTDPTATPVRIQIIRSIGAGSNNGTEIFPVKLEPGLETMQLRAFQRVTLPFFPVEVLAETYLNTRGGALHKIYPDLFPIFIPAFARFVILADISLNWLVGCGGEE